MKMIKRWLAFVLVIALLFGIIKHAGNPLFANELEKETAAETEQDENPENGIQTASDDTGETETQSETEVLTDAQTEPQTEIETEEQTEQETEPPTEKTTEDSEIRLESGEEHVSQTEMESETERESETEEAAEENVNGIGVIQEDGTIRWTKQEQKSYISVIAQPEVLPEKAVLCVTELGEKDAKEIERTVEEQVIEDTPAKESVAIESTIVYDIHFENEEGLEIQPKGEVKVQVTGKATEDGQETMVYHVDEKKESAENMHAVELETQDRVSEGDVEFETTHFSTYTVVNTSADKIQVTVEYYDASKTPAQKIYLDHKEELDNNELKIGSHEGNWKVVKLDVNGKEITDVEQDQIVNVAKQESVVKIYYQATEDYETGNNVTFYDYTLKAGYIGTEKPYWWSTPYPVWAKNKTDKPVSFNNKDNYTDPNANHKICSGFWDGNTTWTPGQHNYPEVTPASEFNWKSNSGYSVNEWTDKDIVTGLLHGINQKGDVVFNYSEPGFFVNEDKGVTVNGETRYTRKVYNDFQIKFLVTGNTFKMQDVLRNGSTVIPEYASTDGYRTVNGEQVPYKEAEFFFPLDGVLPYYENSVCISDAFQDKHNFFFGMRYDVDFHLGEYIGDLKYTFSGDDDMWLVLTKKNEDGSFNAASSKVVLDLGGIHSPVGKTTMDLWETLLGKKDYTQKDKEAFVSNKQNAQQEYRLTILFMERGANKSQCYMEFTIPAANLVNVVKIPKTTCEFTKTKTDGTALEGATFGLYKNAESQQPVQTVTSGADGKVTFTDLYARKTYFVKEITAPPGYEQNTEIWTIAVEQTGNSAKAVMKDSNGNTVTRIINYSEDEEPVAQGSIAVSKQIDAFRDGTDNPDTDLDNKTEDTADLYRLYLDAKSSIAAQPVDILFVVDRSNSMAETFSGETASSDDERRDQTVIKALFGGKATIKSGTASLAEGGLIKDLLSMNEENKVAMIWFGGSTKGYDYNPGTTSGVSSSDSGVSISWITNAESGDTYSVPSSKKDGTNYSDAFRRAAEMFNVAEVKGNGHKKLMLFITDGEPTYYLQYDKGSVARMGNGSTYSVAESVQPSKNNFDKFNTDTGDTITTSCLYTVNSFTGVSQDLLTYMSATKGNGGSAMNVKSTEDLRKNINTLIYGMMPKQVRIQDQLSAYVDLYTEQPDYKMVMRKNTSGEEIILWDKDRVTAEGKNVLKGVSYDEGTRTIQAEFQPGYQLDGEYTYTLSFNIKTNEVAYRTFDKNGTYGTSTGQTNTDYGTNTTSTHKPGFYSNKKATLTYTTDTGTNTLVYPKPVIQVFRKLKLQKLDRYTKETLQGAVFELYKSEADRWEIKGDALESKSTAENGTAEFETRLKTGKYILKEAVAPDGYAAEGPWYLTVDMQGDVILTDTEGNAVDIEQLTYKITNRRLNEIEIEKVDSADPDTTLQGAEFMIERKNGTDWEIIQRDNKDYTVTTKENGRASFSGLPNGTYRLTEIKAPEGYALTEKPVTITVSYDTSVQDEAVTVSKEETYQENNKTYSYHITLKVKNSKLYTLPNSGGIGTYLFTISGVAILMTALLLFLQKERRKKGGNI